MCSVRTKCSVSGSNRGTSQSGFGDIEQPVILAQLEIGFDAIVLTSQWLRILEAVVMWRWGLSLNLALASRHEGGLGPRYTLTVLEMGNVGLPFLEEQMRPNCNN